jgi:hypothetical protein
MSANDYADAVVRDFIRDITDTLFLSIEHDEARMRDYQTNVNRYGLQAVNMAIGLRLKEILNLENDGSNTSPQSVLIKDYTYHKTARGSPAREA